MVNVSTDALIIVPKELRNRIKAQAAKRGIAMRRYLDLIVPKEI
jgi:predicted DNA binding CopG/RHH family protein